MRVGDSDPMLPDSSSTSTTRDVLSGSTKCVGCTVAPFAAGSGAAAGAVNVLGQDQISWLQHERFERHRDCSVTLVASWLPAVRSVRFAGLPWPQHISV